MEVFQGALIQYYVLPFCIPFVIADRIEGLLTPSLLSGLATEELPM